MIPVKLIFEEDGRTWTHVTMLAALPTLDGRTVIVIGGLLFVPFEITLIGHERVVAIHVGGYAYLTRESLIEAGWAEVQDEAAPE